MRFNWNHLIFSGNHLILVFAGKKCENIRKHSIFFEYRCRQSVPFTELFYESSYAMVRSLLIYIIHIFSLVIHYYFFRNAQVWIFLNHESWGSFNNYFSTIYDLKCNIYDNVHMNAIQSRMRQRNYDKRAMAQQRNIHAIRNIRPHQEIPQKIYTDWVFSYARYVLYFRKSRFFHAEWISIVNS